MKLITLNTHSLMENNYSHKLDVLTESIIKYIPDIIALQEVMQPIEGKIVGCNSYAGNIPIKVGNHALNIVDKLKKMSLVYNFVWLGFKKSYDKFEEGVAILTPHKIKQIDVVCASPFDDYNKWKTRKMLGVHILDEWYYSVHFGWWNDKESSFQYELKRFMKAIEGKKAWILGDFNSRDDKGYNLAKKYGLIDSYELAKIKDCGFTAYSNIDGWKKESTPEPIRIDYIFLTRKRKIEKHTTIFNGKDDERISDHNGILVIT